MILDTKMIELNRKLVDGYLLFYGYSYEQIPDQVKKNHTSRMSFYFKESVQKKKIIDDVNICKYNSYRDIGRTSSDVVFFDQDAVKALLIGYPPNSKYVLVNCANVKYLPWVVIGLLRRMIANKVKFLGLKRLTQNGRNSLWLVLSRVQSGNNYVLSREIGIDGLLQYLKTANINYVIPRHYEFLPNLHRVGGDLDLIVSDKDEELVRQFLLNNEGDILVDVWNVSKPDHFGITYMPPLIAQDVINNSVEGRALSKIPRPLDAFNCLVFHALYHKGFNSGISSIHHSRHKNTSSNDYQHAITKKASLLGLKVDCTMEDLDVYMRKIGWCPTIYDLTRTAKRNEWVRIRYFDKDKLSLKRKYFGVKAAMRLFLDKLFNH